MAADCVPWPSPGPPGRGCLDEGCEDVAARKGDAIYDGGGCADDDDDGSPHGYSAKPQSPIACGGRSGIATDVWPEEWGISLRQCRQLLADFREDPLWSEDFTMRDIVERYVKPQTAGLGVGYALQQNLASPLEVNIMVSHAWDENAADFFDALGRSVGEDDGLFICALSLYQCEDGAGPSIAEQLGTVAKDSPFRRVLDHIQSRREEGWLRRKLHQYLRAARVSCFLAAIACFYYPMGAARCVPDMDGCASVTWVEAEHHSLLAYPNCWFPQFESVSSPLSGAYKGFLPAAMTMLAVAVFLRSVEAICCRHPRYFMLAVPNRECDLYSRLWCVYEIFVAKKLGVPVVIARTLAPAGLCRWERARCSSEDDNSRIRSEIARWEERGMFWKKDAAERVERAIKQVTRSAQYSMATTMLGWVAPFIFMKVSMSVAHLHDSNFNFVGFSGLEAPVCDGFLPTAIGGILVLGVAFWIAKVKRGVLNRRICFIASATLVAIGLVLFLINCALDPQNASAVPGPFHHCFVVVLIWGGLSMALVTQLRGLLHLPPKLRVLLVSACAVCSVAVYVWLGAARGARRGQAYPLAVWFISFRAAPMLGVPCVLLASAETWGIRFEGEPLWRGGWRCCRRRRSPRGEASGAASSV